MNIRKYTGLLLGALLLTSASGSFAQVDFSGTYMPGRASNGNVSFPRSGWNYTEYAQQLEEAYTAEFDPIKDESSFFCVQPGMPESMAQFAPFPLEVIQRENDITMFFEAWSQYRKIYIEGYDHPEPILNSRMGYSVGHWEGDVLVVQTDYLSERTMGRSLMSENATITERLYLEEDAEGRKVLVSDMVFTDPVMYKEPIPVRGAWVDSPDTPILEYLCAEELYVDHLERVRAARREAE